jgi:polysaccharide pyruvyl transferase WcaK-like protein
MLQRLQRVRPGCTPTVVTDGPQLPALGRLGLWGGTVAELCQALDPEAIRNGCHGWPDLAKKMTVHAGIQHDPSCQSLDLRSFDSVILCGGGYWAHHWPYLSARRSIIAAAAKAFLIPYVVTGQGLGPMAQDLRPMLAFLAEGARAFGLRDPLSAQLLRDSCGNPVQAEVVGDDALGMAEASPGVVERCFAEAGIPSDSRPLGFHVREADYVGYSREDLLATACLVDDLAFRTGRDVLCLPINSQPPLPESELMANISQHTPRKARWFMVDCKSDMACLAGVLGRCEAVLTQSYHVALLAMERRVPTVIQARTEYYRRKARGLQAFFGIPVDISVPEGASAAGLDLQLQQIARAPWSPPSTRPVIDAWLDQALAKVAARKTPRQAA